MSLSIALPLLGVHLACLGIIFTGTRAVDVWVCLGLYGIRMFGVTGGLHRYFSHRSFKTGRVFQFVLALLGTLAMQNGVLWWAAHHRHHHRESDKPADLHSPVQRGFWWSHLGWILSGQYAATRFEAIRDFARFPELRWLNKYCLVPPVLLGVGLFALGGASMLIWGFFISTVVLSHATFSINSLCHVFGRRRYPTTDDSRNNAWLAVLTLGEGWHNNHHHHPNTANQGWFWWEIDITYYVLKGLAVLGWVWDLRTPSQATRFAHRPRLPSL